MVQFNSRSAARLILVALFLAANVFVSTAALAQTLPHLRTTFVARNRLQPDPCSEFACFYRSSYDQNTLAALGANYPAVYVFLRLFPSVWSERAVLQNRSPLPTGYTEAGYRLPIVVVGDDILVTAYQTGPEVPETCATHVFGRTDTGGWRVKQVINVCARTFAKDANRVLFGTTGQMPIYARGSNGLFAEESRVFPPSDGFFSDEKYLALHAWTVVVGKPSVNSGTGAAYIFQRRGGQWLLMETLTPEGAGAETRFGAAVGVYEYNIAVGAPRAINPSGGQGVVYMYTGVNDTWFLSQEIAEPADTFHFFGTALALRGRRLVVSTGLPAPIDTELHGYLFERGVRESAWVARASLAGNAASIDLSGNTVMTDTRGLRVGTFPTVVNLPALREPDVAP